jgi:hypothetical protein
MGTGVIPKSGKAPEGSGNNFNSLDKKIRNTKILLCSEMSFAAAIRIRSSFSTLLSWQIHFGAHWLKFLES